MVNNFGTYLLYLGMLVFPFAAQFKLRRFSPELKNGLFVAYLVAVVSVVGLRWEVGGDWFTYRAFHSSINDSEPIVTREFLFTTLNQLSTRISSHFWLHNILVALIVFASVFVFLFRAINPFRGIICCLYPLIFLGVMGYVRQCLAISCLMASWKLLRKYKYFATLFCIGAVLMHTSAVLGAVPLLVAIFLSSAWRFRLIAILVGVSLLVFALPMTSEFALNGVRVLQNYLRSGQSVSVGAIPRATLYFCDFAFFFLASKEIKYHSNIDKLLCALSVTYGLALCSLILVIPTVVDRLLLYLTPFVVYMYSNYKFCLRPLCRVRFRDLCFLLLISAKVISFTVWLFWGRNTGDWVPYKTIFD